MLHADKLAFEANLAQDLVAIQMKELDYLYKNLANLATSSAVLVGEARRRDGRRGGAVTP